MTHDPRLPTLEEVMTGSPFDIIDTRLGRMERWRANAMLIGETSGVQSVYEAIRSDSAARADEAQAREALIKHLCAQVDALTSRCDAVANELETTKAEARRRADKEARKAAFDQEPLELPPGDPPGAGEPPAPTGDLHDLPPKAQEPEPSLAEDAEGDLPRELADPPDPVPEPKGSVQQQPISVSLNEG